MQRDPYNIGDAIELSSAFRNDSGQPADPTTITLTVRTPDGAKTTYTFGVDVDLTHGGAGVFKLVFVATLAGRHIYRFVGTGAVEQAREQSFEVKASEILP